MFSPRFVFPGGLSRSEFTGKFSRPKSKGLLSTTGGTVLSKDMMMAILRALDIVSGNFLSQVSAFSSSGVFQDFFVSFLVLPILYCPPNLFPSAFDCSVVPNITGCLLVLLLVIGLVEIVSGLSFSCSAGFLQVWGICWLSIESFLRRLLGF